MKVLSPSQLNKVWKAIDSSKTRTQMFNAIKWSANLKLQKVDRDYIYHMICSKSFNKKHENDIA